MKELPNNLKWPLLNSENIEKLYIYCITKDDDNTIPVTEKDFLASKPHAFILDSKNTLSDYFFEPKFFEAGSALRYMLGQLKCVHNGKKSVSINDIAILYDDSIWCDPNDIIMEKFISLCVGARLMPSVTEDLICNLSNAAITPRTPNN